MKSFLTTSKNPSLSGLIWNSIASVVMAFQSVFLLIVISNINGLGVEAAGVFVIGNSLNNLFLCIGKYGVRNFQVSDVNSEYSFQTYKKARVISVLVMILISVVYVIVQSFKHYSLEKSIIVLFMCLYKIPDAYEDVYYGEYQRCRRLDIASKATALRLIICVVIWTLLLLITKNMLISVILTTIISIIVMFWYINITKELFINEADIHSSLINRDVKSVLFVTMPLAVASFLSIYISTAPRLAIDKLMDDKSQGVYGYIAMPVFVVQIFLMFILNPALEGLANSWKNDINDYIHKSIMQFGFIFILTIVCFIGAFFLGVPVLSYIYNIDLKPYKMDLLIMIIGSGLLALSTLLHTLLTIMRKQRSILIGYIIASLVALMFSERSVELYGIRGAVVIYIIIIALLCLVYLLTYFITFRIRKMDYSKKICGD